MPTFSEHWQFFEETTSTNDSIHQAALEGALEGTIHVTQAQSRGRGREGRTWWSPPEAGLWMSLLLRPRIPAEDASALSLLAGSAVKSALEPLLPNPISLHWPNDLFVLGKKLGGILGELRNQGKNYWIAMGIGINIDHSNIEVPEELRDISISMLEAGYSPSVDTFAPDTFSTRALKLAKPITTAFWYLYDRYQDGESLTSLLNPDDLAHTGKRVRVRISANDTLEGKVKGLGPKGELMVEESSGNVRSVTAGDVEYFD